MTESRSTQPIPDNLLDAVRKSQDMTVEATKRLVDALQSVRASIPIKAPGVPGVPNMPEPEELLANVYNFTEQLLDSHRKFAEGMLEATKPLRSAQEGPAAEEGS